MEVGEAILSAGIRLSVVEAIGSLDEDTLAPDLLPLDLRSDAAGAAIAPEGLHAGNDVCDMARSWPCDVMQSEGPALLEDAVDVLPH